MDKMERKIVRPDPKKLYDLTPTPCKASDFIHHFKDIYYPGILIILYIRVSGREQQRRKNREAQEKQCLEFLGKHDVKIIAIYKETASGWAGDRNLYEIAKEAKNKNAWIVSLSTDRLIRSEDYKSTKQHIQPTKWEFERFVKELDGAKVATILHPDTPWEIVRGIQSKRGMVAKNKKGGRPKNLHMTKAEIDQMNNSKIYWLRFCRVFSVDEISKLTGIPRTTVRRRITMLLGGGYGHAAARIMNKGTP